MTATIEPTRKARHPSSAPPVVPMVLLAVALLIGVSTLAHSPGSSVVHPAPVARSVPTTAVPVTVAQDAYCDGFR